MTRRSRIFALLSALALSLCPAISAQTFTETVLTALTQHYANSLLLASDGNFYGTTDLGGGSGLGSVFRITPSGAYSTVYSFTAADGMNAGNQPGALIQGTDGNFYGVLENGGAVNPQDEGNCGGVFRVTPAGSMTPVASFDSQYCDFPTNIVQGTDGNFYGTTFSGGASFEGSIFVVTPAGAYTELYDFTGGVDGANPLARLVEYTPGVFYGTTSGTVFRIDTVAGFSTVAQLPLRKDGSAPLAHEVTPGSDGNFYGALQYGGAGDDGAIFSMTPAGVVTVLYTFTGGADQAHPSGLLLGGDGNLYGSSNSGATGTYGTVFQVTEAGAFKTILALSGGTNGSTPAYDLLQGPGGVLYETASFDGANNDGVFFSLSAAPQLAQPITITVSPASVAPGGAITVGYTVANGYGSTSQLCFASTAPATSSAWSGVRTGKPTTQTSTLNAPTVAGTYTYALTCGGRESAFATLTVGTPEAPSTTTLTATPNPSTVGQPVTLKAIVNGTKGTPTGTATFSIAGNSIAVVALNAGSASLPVTTNGLPSGTYPLVATYSGNTIYNPSSSPSYNVVINPAPTATTLKASPNPVTPPATLTFTATVKRSASGAVGTPAGQVTFYYSTIALDTATLNAGGTATYSLSTNGLPAGTYPITAKYAGDTSDAASTAAAVSVTVK